MSDIIYRKNYRAIWESYYGPIPKDDDGRSYEIHHIDGNRKNNSIENLKCVSIKEHYEIHKAQKDYGACFLIAARMNQQPNDISEIASKAGAISAKKLLKEGRHNFQILDRSKYNFYYRTEKGKAERIKKNKEMYKNGSKFFDSERCKKTQASLIKEGKHNLFGGVTCRDKFGKVVQVESKKYWSQEGPKESWEFVSINSKEGKNRKQIK